MSTSAGSSSGINSSTSTQRHQSIASERRALIREARNRKKQRLAWFQGRSGTILRTQHKNHVRSLLNVRQSCQLCNLNNVHGNSGVKTYVLCWTCHVPLSNTPKQHRRTSCWDEWHSVPELFQRTSIRPTPRLKR